MPILMVQRDKGLVDKYCKYRIYLDGIDIGKIGEGEVIRQLIADGPHIINAKIAWCGSRPLHFDVQEDDKVVVVRISTSEWCLPIALFIDLFYIIFNRYGYLTLVLDSNSLNNKLRHKGLLGFILVLSAYILPYVVMSINGQYVDSGYMSLSHYEKIWMPYGFCEGIIDSKLTEISKMHWEMYYLYYPLYEFDSSFIHPKLYIKHSG